jgi:hypothetical protein
LLVEEPKRVLVDAIDCIDSFESVAALSFQVYESLQSLKPRSIAAVGKVVAAPIDANQSHQLAHEVTVVTMRRQAPVQRSIQMNLVKAVVQRGQRVHGSMATVSLLMS